MRDEITNNSSLTHERSREYGSRIIEAMETNVPFKFGERIEHRVDHKPAGKSNRGSALSCRPESNHAMLCR